MEEMIVKEEKHEVSPFADSQSFQKIFDIGKMFARITKANRWIARLQ